MQICVESMYVRQQGLITCYSKTDVCVCVGDITIASQQRRTRMLVKARYLDVITILYVYNKSMIYLW